MVQVNVTLLLTVSPHAAPVSSLIFTQTSFVEQTQAAKLGNHYCSHALDKKRHPDIWNGFDP